MKRTQHDLHRGQRGIFEAGGELGWGWSHLKAKSTTQENGCKGTNTFEIYAKAMSRFESHTNKDRITDSVF